MTKKKKDHSTGGYRRDSQEIIDDPNIPTWDRQPYETKNSFLAFSIYRDLGPTRTVLQAHKKYCQTRGLPEPKSTGYSGMWSSQHHWSRRAEEYDRHMERIKQEAREDAVVRAQNRIADELVSLVEKAIEKALEGDSRLLIDLLDRGGLKPDTVMKHEGSIMDPEALKALMNIK